MDLGVVLDVAVGVIFVYLLLSLLVTAVNEYISAWLNKRSTFLIARVAALLGEKPTGNDRSNWGDDMKAFWSHPLIGQLKADDTAADETALNDKTAKNAPSYIPSRTFALALIDVINPAGDAATTLAAVRAKLGKRLTTDPDDPLAKALLPLADAAKDDLAAFQQAVANWFDNAMDRVSGAY